MDVLAAVEVVVGYKTYLDLIKPLVGKKEIVRSGMTKEVQRVQTAIDLAINGQSCALVSSGDPGIYAMAGLVFETCSIKGIRIVPPARKPVDPENSNALALEIVPGIPALCAGAALLGAPLMHDFAAISLSDLLTPWTLIEQRLEAAAQADFVIVLYNPKSTKRTWQLEMAQQIVLNYRDAQTPVGVVVGAMRANQDVQIVSLDQLHTVHVDMQTTVFIGNSTSSKYLDFMYTPRGYSQKYALQP
jgi:precorrin-3B C17-methyltransferase